jgi:hypothetical protein
MISTVTTTTVTTIVTLTTGASLGVLATILLISLLGTKELAGGTKKYSLQVLSRYLNVSIFPLLAVFTLIVTLKIAEVL